MWILWLAVIGLAVAVIWWATRRSNQGNGRREESPEQILKRRYASGEIDQTEYEEKREQLRR